MNMKFLLGAIKCKYKTEVLIDFIQTLKETILVCFRNTFYIFIRINEMF